MEEDYYDDYGRDEDYPCDSCCREDECDGWEGEKFIKLFGIQSVCELDISGGIYTKD